MAKAVARPIVQVVDSLASGGSVQESKHAIAPYHGQHLYIDYMWSRQLRFRCQAALN